jgi:hypothetical protein
MGIELLADFNNQGLSIIFPNEISGLSRAERQEVVS